MTLEQRPVELLEKRREEFFFLICGNDKAKEVIYDFRFTIYDLRFTIYDC